MQKKNNISMGLGIIRFSGVLFFLIFCHVKMLENCFCSEKRQPHGFFAETQLKFIQKFKVFL